MDFIKCPECGNEIDINNEACQNCGCPITEIIKNDKNIITNIKETVLNYYNDNKPTESLNDALIQENINSINKINKIIQTVCLILTILGIIFTCFIIIMMIDSDDYAFLLLLSIPFTFISGIIGYSIDTFLNWKAYMLLTNYNIYKNTKIGE